MKHPGALLEKDFLRPLGITAYQLAKGIGVRQTRISEIIHGKRSITADTAVRLGAFFDVPPRWFMDLQTRFDLERAAESAIGIERHPGRYWVRPTGAKRLGPAPPARPMAHRIDRDFRERVRKQAALSPPRQARDLVAVEYDDGMQAIVGKEEV